jgi:hypothetical protein
MNLLLEALARRWDWLWRRERREEGQAQVGDRRHFWSEFRAGQQQAEEASSENVRRSGRDA